MEQAQTKSHSLELIASFKRSMNHTYKTPLHNLNLWFHIPNFGLVSVNSEIGIKVLISHMFRLVIRVNKDQREWDQA